MAVRIYIGGNVYGAGNIGDDAVLQGLLGLLAEAVPGAVFVTGTHHGKRLDYLPSGIVYTDADDPLAVANAARSCDVVVSGGGTMIGDELGVAFPLGANSDLLGIAALHGKRTAMLGIGANRLGNPEAIELGRALMDLANLVTTRDAESRDVCLSLGADPDRILVTADPAFLLTAKESVRTRVVKQRLREHGKLLGVSLVNEVWSQEKGYKRGVAEACDRLAETRGLRTVFFCNEVRAGNYFDYEACKQAAFLMKGEAELLSPTYYSPEEMMDILSCFDAVLGMRMHALIFAAVAGTPFVALSRVDKVDNFMRQFGLQVSGTIDACDGERLALDVESILDDSDMFRAHMAERVSELRDACPRNVGLLAELLAEERETRHMANPISLSRLLREREAEIRRLRGDEAEPEAGHRASEQSSPPSMSWRLTEPPRSINPDLHDPKRPPWKRLFGAVACNMRRFGRNTLRRVGAARLEPEPGPLGSLTLYHVVAWYAAKDTNTARRMRVARESWERLYASSAGFDRLWHTSPRPTSVPRGRRWTIPATRDSSRTCSIKQCRAAAMGQLSTPTPTSAWSRKHHVSFVNCSTAGRAAIRSERISSLSTVQTRNWMTWRVV